MTCKTVALYTGQTQSMASLVPLRLLGELEIHACLTGTAIKRLIVLGRYGPARDDVTGMRYLMLWDLRLISFQQRFMSWSGWFFFCPLHWVGSSCPSASTADWQGTQWHPGHEGRPAAATHNKTSFRNPHQFLIMQHVFIGFY